MNLYDINTVKRILMKHGFTFSKALGQNFIIDPEVCPAMADALCADEKTGVLEIGPGIGVLTKELCKVCGKVISIELDKRLFPVLKETLSEFDNLEIVEGDVLKLNLQEIIKEKLGGMHSVKVCANLPYYITSPIIMNLLESRLPIECITVMVQKEAGVRLCAEPGTREAGAVSAAVRYYAEPKMLFNVSRGSFMPAPNVDSCVIRLDIKKEPPVKVSDEKLYFHVVRGAFSQRRKTLVNSLSSVLGVPKAEAAEAVKAAGLPENIRPEQLRLEDFAAVSEQLTQPTENR